MDRPRLATSLEVIPPFAIQATEEWLPSHSTLTARIYEDVAHGIHHGDLASAHMLLFERFFDILQAGGGNRVRP